MRIKTIVVILIAVLLTVILMQNTESVKFNLLWATFWMSKLVMLFFVALIAFVLGVLVGRPKKVKQLGGEFGAADSDKGRPNTLSDEDKEYIN